MPDGVATWSTTFVVMELLLDSFRADLGDLKTGIGGDFDNVGALLVALRADIEAVKTELGLLDIPPDTSPEVGTLRADVAELKTSVTNLLGRMGGAEGRITNLQGNVANLFQITDALQTMPVPITFAFAGTPVQGSMVNIPLTMNLSIPNGLAGSRYYNATAPLVASVFTLTRLPANTILATINVNTSGQGTITGPGAANLSATDTLRLTATTIGGSLANVSITIQAARR